MDEVTGEWRKLHNEELTKHNSGNELKKNELDRVFDMYGLEERCTQGFGGET